MIERCETCKGAGRHEGPEPDETWTHDPFLCASCGGVGFKIPIKRYVMDAGLSWEARYRKLEEHHAIETGWLIDEIRRTFHKNIQIDEKTELTTKPE